MNSRISPIDVVITWVDGDDPIHRAKRYSYMHGTELKYDDIGGETRYRQVGEIFFCVASILRFAPFVRKIHIVTDNQNPKLEEFIALNFPDSTTQVEVVDHKVIFRGYEDYLPIFNSLAIETMLWRIPGLAEHFIYLNDDNMFVAPVAQNVFFDEFGRPTCYAHKMAAWKVDLLQALTPRRGGHKHYGYKKSLLNGARAAGLKHFFLNTGHTPLPMRRSVFEKYYDEHPDLIIRNISHRFRNENQYNPQSMFYSILQMRGECNVVSWHGLSVCMKPKAGDKRYFKRKLKKLDSPSVIFFCVNSLDKACPDEQELLRQHLCNRLNIKLPNDNTTIADDEF